ncbi:hypothetical protein CR513_21292, partial [Mucuna pruriens]
MQRFLLTLRVRLSSMLSRCLILMRKVIPSMSPTCLIFRLNLASWLDEVVPARREPLIAAYPESLGPGELSRPNRFLLGPVDSTWCFSRLRKHKSKTKRLKVVRGDRLAYHRTLVDLILNILANRGGPSLFDHGNHRGRWIHRIHTILMMMDRHMIDAASGGARMDNTPVAMRHLISNMVSNMQQFGTKGVVTSRVVIEVDAIDNLRCVGDPECSHCARIRVANTKRPVVAQVEIIAKAESDSSNRIRKLMQAKSDFTNQMQAESDSSN